uniref:Uncharacterized protein n=1 Tax=Buteo japonicus TaxID=224669 RepID=A0A8B9Z5A2_9AVES
AVAFFSKEKQLTKITILHKVIIVGLDNAGKTTILYQFHSAKIHKCFQMFPDSSV